MGRSSLSSSQSAIMPLGGVTQPNLEGSPWGQPGLSPILHRQITPYLVGLHHKKLQKRPSNDKGEHIFCFLFGSDHTHTACSVWRMIWEQNGSAIAGYQLPTHGWFPRPIALQLFQRGTIHLTVIDRRGGVAAPPAKVLHHPN